MEEQICPKYQKCPIFSGEAFKRQSSKDVYQSLFCKAGPAKYKSCKRYIVAEKAGKPAPISVMPNSQKTVDEIIAMIK